MDAAGEAVQRAARTTARDLRAEASATDERRALVLAGDREAGYTATRAAVEATGIEAVSLSERDVVGTRIAPDRAGRLLGTTHDCVVVDCHDACRPNALGGAAGAVDGGGLLILLTPSLERWPDERDDFDETLAVPPSGRDDVAGRFRRRLVDTLEAHRGVAIVDVDDGTVRDDGLTHPAPGVEDGADVPLPDEHDFPRAVYEACLTADQRDAVRACERLRDPERAVVLQADRGRGKSSAAGLAAAALAATGDDVLVTAQGFRNAAELFARAEAGLESLDERGPGDDQGAVRDADRSDPTDAERILRTRSGGRIRYLQPTDALEASADVLVVDEAAALPVRILEDLLAVAPGACFATTVHGYEGAGRGFDVRFRGRLEDAMDTETVALAEPIRYAAADPVEVWSFRTLLLDARPPVDPLVTGASPADATYEALDRDALVADENRLREAFGLLVAAHYRTEPDDLARLLDAPNIALRALTVDGHVVAVAMLAREGGLPVALRQEIYEGARVRGNMFPDVLTSQLRDPDAAVPVGLRVMRIATHHAVRSRGLGSRLLAAIEREFEGGGADNDNGADDPDAAADEDGATPEQGGDPGRRTGDAGELTTVDYLGVGYGATPALLAFWGDAGYETVHLSTTRNATSGEYSALMIRPLSPAGRELADRHGAWFRRRIAAVLADALADADPDVVRGALAATAGAPTLDLTDAEWRVVASSAFGPGLYDVAPGPFRRLALRALVDGALDDAAAERLLVAKVLQARPWDDVAEALEYVSRRQCMRALGEAYRPLVDHYGGDVATAEADRYREGEEGR